MKEIVPYEVLVEEIKNHPIKYTKNLYFILKKYLNSLKAEDVFELEEFAYQNQIFIDYQIGEKENALSFFYKDLENPEFYTIQFPDELEKKIRGNISPTIRSFSQYSEFENNLYDYLTFYQIAFILLLKQVEKEKHIWGEMPYAFGIIDFNSLDNTTSVFEAVMNSREQNNPISPILKEFVATVLPNNIYVLKRNVLVKQQHLNKKMMARKIKRPY